MERYSRRHVFTMLAYSDINVNYSQLLSAIPIQSATLASILTLILTLGAFRDNEKEQSSIGEVGEHSHMPGS